jgi:hypothetical protein
MRDLTRLALVTILSFGVVGAAMIYAREGNFRNATTSLVDTVTKTASTTARVFSGVDRPTVPMTAEGQPIATRNLQIGLRRQDGWVGLTGMPSQADLSFALPNGIGVVSGELNLLLNAHLANSGDGRLSIAIDGIPREEIVLNGGEQTRRVRIPLTPTDLLGREIQVQLNARGTTNGGQICPTDAANSGSAIQVAPESVLNLVAYSLGEEDDLDLMAASEPFDIALGTGEQQARAMWGAQRLYRNGINVTVDSNRPDAARLVFRPRGGPPVRLTPEGDYEITGEVGVARLLQLRGRQNDRTSDKFDAWPIAAEALTSDVGVRNFRSSKRWMLDYRLADLPGGLMPTNFNVALRTSALAEGNEWVVRVSLNQTLLETRRFSGNVGDIRFPIALPAELQHLSNSLRVELVDTSPNISVCQQGPDAQAQLLPDTRLLADGRQPATGWAPLMKLLAESRMVDLTVHGTLSAPEATQAWAMLGLLVPIQSNVRVARAEAPVHLTVISARELAEMIAAMPAGDSTTPGDILIHSDRSGDMTLAAHDMRTRARAKAELDKLDPGDVTILVRY